MKILEKYIYRQFLTPLAYLLFGLCLMTVVADVSSSLSRFVEAKASVWIILRYYGCVLFQSLDYLAPASLLLATLYSQWRMSRNSELTAMRATGVSFYRILVPYVTVGLIFSLVLAVSKETLGPGLEQWSRQVSRNRWTEPTREMYQNLAFYNNVHNREWVIDAIDLKNPSRLKGVTLRLERTDNSRALEIRAERAEYLDGRWWFFGGTIFKINRDGVPDPAQKPRPLNPAGEEMAWLTERPKDFVMEVRQLQALSAGDMARYLRKHPRLSRGERALVEARLHSRLAMPWACLVVTLFGIPAGARGGKQSALTGIFIALGFFLGFYALNHIGVYLGMKHYVEPWLGAWLANIVAGAAGLTLLVRTK